MQSRPIAPALVEATCFDGAPLGRVAIAWPRRVGANQRPRAPWASVGLRSTGTLTRNAAAEQRAAGQRLLTGLTLASCRRSVRLCQLQGIGWRAEEGPNVRGVCTTTVSVPPPTDHTRCRRSFGSGWGGECCAAPPFLSPTTASGTWTTTSVTFNSSRQVGAGITINEITDHVSYTGTLSGTSILHGILIFFPDRERVFSRHRNLHGNGGGEIWDRNLRSHWREWARRGLPRNTNHRSRDRRSRQPPRRAPPGRNGGRGTSGNLHRTELLMTR